MTTSSLAVNFTRKMIQIESTDPGTYENNMADWLSKQLNQLPDVKLTREEVLPGRPNLMAELPGPDDIPALIMICHMDTVVVGDGWTMDPFAAYEKDGLIYGRGACDMKSGLACCLSAFISAARQLHESKKPAKRKLKLICTMDEEDFMRGSEACIRSGWVTDTDWVIDAEPTDGQIQVAHKGRTWYEIEVQGHTAHASTPWKGADAIAAMAEIIHSVRLDIQAAPSHPDMGASTVTFGQITGGYRPYVVPDYCKLWIDMRLVPPLNTEKTSQIVEKAIKVAMAEVPGIRASYVITGDRPPIEKDPGSQLLAYLKDACANITGETDVTCFTGYTDTAVIAGQLHNHNCMSYGPGSLEAAHQPDEWVAIEDIIRCEKVYCELVRLTIFN
ncbi:MAG: M20 family metallopeptidase [Coprococcus sp.]